MKVYLVGGAVRDELMELVPKDLDYVVVGSTPEEMLSLGYKQVGCDFPVFLHPETGDEYALARTEVKDGKGYGGFNCDFSPEVTLVDDLGRRDLTINAIAKDLETGEYIDPYQGRKHIQIKLLQEVSSSFRDDPVRVLRVARFLARLGYSWTISLSLIFYCCQVIQDEFLNLTKERVFLELSKTLSEPYPELFFEYLRNWGENYWFREYFDNFGIPQRPDHHPEIDTGSHQQMCLQQGARMNLSPKEMFAVMCHDFGKSVCYKARGNLYGHEEVGVAMVNNFCDLLKTPSDWRELAVKVCAYHTYCHKFSELTPKSLMKLLNNLGLNKTELVKSFALCCEADARGRLGLEDRGYLQGFELRSLQQFVNSMDTKSISKSCLERGLEGKAIGNEIHGARISLIKTLLRGSI